MPYLRRNNSLAEKKASKTARASMGGKDTTFTGKHCPACGSPMVATKVMKSENRPGGMYWVCAKDDQRIRI
jgi:formate dehydrogenase maturation protein FdhE